MFKAIKQIISQVDAGFLYFMLILIGVAILVFVIRKVFLIILHPIRKAKVQVANMERQDQNINAVARKLSAGIPVNGNRPSSNHMQMMNMGHAMVDNIIYTFYLLDKDNKTIKLKIQANLGTNMAQIGDIGYVTYQEGVILGFEKIGNIND